MGPGGPGPPLVLYQIISASHVQYGIHTFAEFKCPGCTFKIASQRTSLNLKNFPAGACAQNSLEPCTVRIPDGHYCTHIAIVYYISIPPLSQNPPSDAVIPTTPATNQLIIYLKYIMFIMLFSSIWCTISKLRRATSKQSIGLKATQIQSLWIKKLCIITVD